MAYYPVLNPFDIFFDTNGDPLEDGYIYIGSVGQNPETSPVSIFWDAGSTPAAQPIRTRAGYPVRDGSPGNIFLSGDYSITVRNKKGELVYSALSNKVAAGPEFKVASVAALRLLSIAGDGDVVFVVGYNDGSIIGGGNFVWNAASTATENDIDIIKKTGVATGRFLKLTNSEGIDVAEAGAVYDGVTDNTAAVLKTIPRAAALGIPTIISGDCRCTTATSAGGLSWILDIKEDDVHLVIKDGGKLWSDTAAALMTVWGAGKPAGMASWSSYEYADATSYGMSNATKGAISITLTTPAEASNFSVGDIAFIFSGQTIPGGTGEESDSELNIVEDSNATTGVITFRWPLSKAYAQENYNVGSSGVSSVGGGGTLAPFGIANVTDRTMLNFSITGGGLLQSASGQQVVNGGQLLYRKIDGIRAIAGNAFESVGNYRSSILTNSKIHLANPGLESYFASTAKGTTDVIISNNAFSAEGFGYLHVHEGSANVRSYDNTYTNPPGASAIAVMDLRARVYDFKSTGDIILGAGATNAVYIDADTQSSGYIDDLTVDAPGTTRAIRCAAPDGWEIGKIHTALPLWIEPDNFLLNGKNYIPAIKFSNTIGSASFATVGGGRWPAWLLDAASTEEISTVKMFDQDWQSISFKVHYTNAGAGSGDIRVQMAVNIEQEGGGLNGAADYTQGLTITVPAQDILDTFIFTTDIPVTQGDTISFRFARLGADAADTLANDIGILGIEAVRIG